MKITIISLDKWGYNDFIAQELSAQGHEVFHLNFYNYKYKYPSFFHKIYNFLLKTLFNYNIKREHLSTIIHSKLEKTPKQDYILLIKGDNLPLKTIQELKLKTHKLITFYNDSFDRYPRMKKTYPLFDETYSFDPDDVKKYNFKLITNFIYFDYLNNKKEAEKDAVFNISSLDKRHKNVLKFIAYFKKHNIKYNLFVYTKKANSDLESLKVTQISHTLNLEKVFKLVQQHSFLLDMQRPKQKGLSFRVFESIALEKKLITTNKDVENYDFYNPNNIAIVDPDNIQIPEDFFTTSYSKIPNAIIAKYHISSWVKNVFI